MATETLEIDHAAHPPERGGWFGPIFFWELVRESRKGNNYLPRVAYAGGLLLLLYLVMGRTELTNQRIIGLTEEALFYYLLFQYLAVFLLTPVYVAGAIIEYRHQRMFSLLLTTYLTPREIVQGKLMGRMVPMLGILLAGVPVLAILQLMGGISIKVLAFHSALSLLLLFTVGAYSIRASTLCKTIGGAVMTTYGTSLLPVLIAFPFAMVFLQSHIHPSDLMTGLFLMGICFLLARRALHKAIESISRRDKDQDFSLSQMEQFDQQLNIANATLNPSQPDSPEVNPDQPIGRVHRAERFLNPPRVRNRPIVWKEASFPPTDVVVAFSLLGCGFPFLVFMNELHKSIRFYAEWSHALLALLFAFTAIRAAGTLSTERKRHTLVSLLTTPLSRQRILWEFAVGSIWRYRWLAGGTLLIIACAAMFDPSTILLLIPACVSQLVFFAMIGVACSLAFSSAFKARLFLSIVFFIGYLVLPWLKILPGASSLWVLEIFLSPYRTLPGVLNTVPTMVGTYGSDLADSPLVLLAIMVAIQSILSYVLLEFSRYRLGRWLERGMVWS